MYILDLRMTLGGWEETLAARGERSGDIEERTATPAVDLLVASHDSDQHKRLLCLKAT